MYPITKCKQKRHRWQFAVVPLLAFSFSLIHGESIFAQTPVAPKEPKTLNLLRSETGLLQKLSSRHEAEQRISAEEIANRLSNGLSQDELAESFAKHNPQSIGKHSPSQTKPLTSYVKPRQIPANSLIPSIHFRPNFDNEYSSTYFTTANEDEVLVEHQSPTSEKENEAERASFTETIPENDQSQGIDLRLIDDWDFNNLKGSRDPSTQGVHSKKSEKQPRKFDFLTELFAEEKPKDIHFASDTKESDSSKPLSGDSDDDSVSGDLINGDKHIQSSGRTSQINSTMQKVAYSTIGVLVVAVGSILILKKTGFSRHLNAKSKETLSVVQSATISNKCKLQLVEILNHKILVGIDSSGIKSVILLPNSFTDELAQAEDDTTI